MILSIFYFILVLSFLVLIHELGHFLVAVLVGARVEEFGLGYPPRAKKLFTWKKTLFSLNWIPFGGFVKLYGEETKNLSNEPQSSVLSSSSSKSEAFYLKPAWARFSVIVAGPLVNLIFGILAYSLVFVIIGVPVELKDQARIGYVAPDSPAAQAGIVANTNIIALRTATETFAITSTVQAVQLIGEHQGKEVTLVTSGLCQQDVCQELAQEFLVYIRTEAELENSANQGALGVGFQTQYLTRYPLLPHLFASLSKGAQTVYELITMTLLGLGQMLGQIFSSGQVPAAVLSPFGIGHEVVKQDLFASGLIAVLEFAGLLSTALAVMNLLPIPALDGGRLVFILLEPIFSRRRLEKIEAPVNYAGFILLVSLLLIVSVRDLWQITTAVITYYQGS